MTEQAIVPLIFELPFPPTVNNLFVNSKKGRFTSPAYKAWKTEAGMIAKAQARGKRVAGPYALELQLSRPDKRRRDASNYIKPVEDLLVWLGITDDDSECQRVTAEWVGRGEGVRVAVRPTKRWGEADGLLSSSAMGG
jgi:crossover junction endodeoxyribonuclease RusA